MLARAGMRIVNRDWGPRGFRAAFEAAKRAGLGINVVLDIGAARGTWTEDVTPIFPTARYILVDPLPENEATLMALAARSSNVRYVKAAIGAASGLLNIYAHGDQSSFFASSDFYGDPIPVPVKTCDEVLSAEPDLPAPAVVLMKIDVQGYEIEVLKGAEKTLEDCVVLLVEVSTQRSYENAPLAHEVIAYLGDRGFCIYDVASYVQRPLDRALSYMDLVFVRSDSVLVSRVGWKECG